MEEGLYSDVLQLRRGRRCCRRGTQVALLGLVTATLWAGLLTLLLLWHRDTVQGLRQLEDIAAQNVSQVSKDMEGHKGDQMAQKAQVAQVLQNMEEMQAEQKRTEIQVAQVLQNMEEMQAEQKRMEIQDSELSQNLDGLVEDLSNFKSQGLNERRSALNSLERLQEEVAKLWIELRVSNGSMCNTCPERWVSFQRKCYYFGEGAKRWIQARNACSGLRGRLVSIHSQEEQDFLATHSNKKGSWIGLRDLHTEGEFVWMDQSPLDYSNWRPGEPNNGGQGEDCVMLLGSGQWNDAFCSSYLDGWVCDRLATC
ncbi:low affinity immunoglobulin epsilon Fc receptor [Myotis myotis]|uniref:Fc of IgE receptor II n=1 Tax=Myotis myotis TaxID=51298 RepID=A0A7J7XFP2_MYOMY|nr:low affinity immunoglobulin epsilon Fc receptor [Myotis myotis]XP_036169976.1 low affinity immunoglobulin epsilon Fc receptor [Myotis myotis]KAF6348484.1 Fc fragment of IgE receptor II [Myotis myotis]